MREADGPRWMEKVEYSSGELADQYVGGRISREREKQEPSPPR